MTTDPKTKRKDARTQRRKEDAKKGSRNPTLNLSQKDLKFDELMLAALAWLPPKNPLEVLNILRLRIHP